MNSRMAAHHSPRNKRDCAAVGVCAKEIKPELNTLDEADFVRDVANNSNEVDSVKNVLACFFAFPSTPARLRSCAWLIALAFSTSFRFTFT